MPSFLRSLRWSWRSILRLLSAIHKTHVVDARHLRPGVWIELDRMIVKRHDW